MRILIGGASSKFFHLEEFGEALIKNGVEYNLVSDVDTYDGFPSRKISKWFQTKKKFNSIIKEFNPDGVFIDRQSHFGVAVLETKLPLLVHLRGDYWSELKWAKETLYKDTIKKNVLWFKNKLAERCFQESTLILPICNYLKKIVDRRYPDKSETLYQGIDPKRWYKVEGMNLKHPCAGLLQSATIWGKTKEMLTLPKVLEAFPKVTFYWAGDGPYGNKILSILEKYDNFKWLGSMKYPDQVREYLSEIDIYALISGIDMSPLTLQEAQLMKKPVIATNVGGIPELMRDKETGFLVEKGNPNQLIEKISLLLNDEKKSELIGEKGREFITKTFSWDKIAKDFIKIIKQNLK